ncbi:MAG: 30S ribosomal protein S13 [Candidatus Pacebacteria bacterium]|nr:30S ribosomal protein S13 [Candidatus Paceibacterota bacterium]
MPRLVGVDIPEHKKTLYSLTAIYGVGLKVSEKVLDQAGVDKDKRARDLNQDELGKINKVLENYINEGNLRRQVNENIQRLKRTRAYRGLRHIANLPSRGQRTKTNSRTARGGGKRRTVGAMTKEMAAKLDAAKSKK